MTTIAEYLEMPIRELRTLVRRYLCGSDSGAQRSLSSFVGGAILRLMLTRASIGGMAWFLGIKKIDDVIDLQADTVFDGMTKDQYLEHITQLFGSLSGQGDPELITALPTDLPIILALREGWRMSRNVRPMLEEMWADFLPDARRQIAGDTFPNRSVQVGANRTNVLYGIVWAYLLGVPIAEATWVMYLVVPDIREADNLLDLRGDIEGSCAHYSKEQLAEANIDRAALEAARTWEEIFAVANVVEWYHDRAEEQVRKWRGSSRPELTRLFRMAPGLSGLVYSCAAWLFASAMLHEAKIAERFSRKFLKGGELRSVRPRSFGVIIRQSAWAVGFSGTGGFRFL
jgi:hypothetical protein